MRAASVVVVGSVNLDLIQRVPVLPRPGQTVLGGVSSQAPGGKGANQAVAAARAAGLVDPDRPASVAFVGRVGDDDAGRSMLEGLARDGIDTTHLAATPGAATGTAVILVEPSGQNCIAVASGANAELRPGDATLAGDLLADAAVVLLQMESPPETVDAAVRATAPDATVVLNYAPGPDTGGPALDLSRVDVLVVNEHEAAALLGRSAATVLRDPVGAAEALCVLGPAAAVVTLGVAGGVAVDAGGGTHRFRGHRVQAVDATAAGDTFCGVLAACLAEGASLADALAYANTAAAVAVQTLGAQPSIPTAAAVRGFVPLDGAGAGGAGSKDAEGDASS